VPEFFGSEGNVCKLAFSEGKKWKRFMYKSIWHQNMSILHKDQGARSSAQVMGDQCPNCWWFPAISDSLLNEPFDKIFLLVEGYQRR